MCDNATITSIGSESSTGSQYNYPVNNYYKYTLTETIIDSALLVMHDWACGLLLLPEEIDAERGVIREEWRTVSTPGRRLYKKIVAEMYPGTQYGKRDVIGDTAVINNFAYDALRAYYKKWYGPDNQAIIVVGDIDVDQIENKIKTLWANVPARVNRGERPLYTVNFNERARVAIATDKEAQGTGMDIEYLHPQLDKKLQNTDYSYRLGLCRSLICAMMNNRFADLTQDPNANYTGAGVSYGETVKLKDAFSASVSPKEGKETAALQDLIFQLEKMLRYGFTRSELERAKINMLNGYERSYASRTTRDNISYAREYIRNFENGEDIPGISWELEFVKRELPTITLDELNQLAKTMMHDKPTVAITGPEKEGIHIPQEAEVLAMLNGMKDLKIDAPKEEKINTTLVKKAPKKGSIKNIKKDEQYGTTEWTLSNGIHVIFKPTKIKEDEISLQAFSKGGSSLVPTEDLPSVVLTSDLVHFMGKGNFSMNELNKALAGKSASSSVSIDTYGENVWGGSSVKDFETMLQLVYLQFTAPRRDEKAFLTRIEQHRQGMLNRDKNPKTIFSDSLKLFSSNHSERALIFDMNALNKVSLDKVMKIYKERFVDNPGDFTFLIYGNINPEDEKVKAGVCQWIGGLKTKNKVENWKDWGVRTLKGIQKNYFAREMEIHTATNRIQYTSYDIPYSLANSLNLRMIGRILSTRYLESIREREGGSYGVGCGGGLNRIPVPCAYLVMQFDTDPDKQERLMQIIHEEVQTIVKNGPLASDLQKEKESMLKDFEEQLEQNGWWRAAVYDRYVYGEDYLNEYKAAVEAITAESVQAMLKRLVASGNMFELVMFPDK